MEPQQDKITIWLQRALRASSESQKFHLLACTMLAVNDKKKFDKYIKLSNKHKNNIEKMLKMAIKFGWDPDKDKNEKENRDRV